MVSPKRDPLMFIDQIFMYKCIHINVFQLGVVILFSDINNL
jgi:hypothetical protein